MNNSEELLKRSLWAHSQALAKGEYSSRELTLAYLDRIEQNDKNEDS